MDGITEFRRDLNTPGPLQELIGRQVQGHAVNLLQLGQALGYQITEAEFNAARDNADELSPYELDLVSGGGGGTVAGPGINNKDNP